MESLNLPSRAVVHRFLSTDTTPLHSEYNVLRALFTVSRSVVPTSLPPWPGSADSDSEDWASAPSVQILIFPATFMSGVGLLSDYSDPEDPHSMSLAAVNSDPSGNKADIENRFLLEDTEKSWIQRLSNQTVLGITCALFFIFVVAEVIGALVSFYSLLLYCSDCAYSSFPLLNHAGQ